MGKPGPERARRDAMRARLQLQRAESVVRWVHSFSPEIDHFELGRIVRGIRKVERELVTRLLPDKVGGLRRW